MYKYEFGHIIECESKKDEEIQKVIGEVRQMISDLNGRIVKEDVWGKRELSYPIKKQNHGFYMFTTMMMEPAAVVEFEKKLKLLEGSLRYLLINLDKEPGYAKQVAADEGDDEKIKTRKPAKTEEATEDGEKEKTVKADQSEELVEETVAKKPARAKKIEKEEAEPPKEKEKESKKEDEEEVTEEVVEKEPTVKDKEDDKKYDELLDEKLSEIL